MLIFGPYHAAPKDDETFTIFNFSSPTEFVPRLPGLLVSPPPEVLNSSDMEKAFDIWYYNYLVEDYVAFMSMMSALSKMISGNVYICIANYSDGFINVLNESFMKAIQSRYDIKYAIVNTSEDLDYLPKDGCDFASIIGIQQFDEDYNDFMICLGEEYVESQISKGLGIPNVKEE